MTQNGQTTEDSPVHLQRDQNQVLLYLPSALNTEGINDWDSLWQNLKHHLNGSEKFWQPQTSVTLKAKDRLLDTSQLSAIAQALSQVELSLTSIETTRRQTAVAAATAGYSVIQPSPNALVTPLEQNQIKNQAPLYLQTTVRSGMEIRHDGTLIIVGDVNPGGAVIAQGEIIVWGRLRGIAHAGCQGDRACRILALQMQPTQLRIDDVVARAPKTKPHDLQPEIAYVSAEGIRITRGLDFLKTHRFVQETELWEDFPN